MSGGEHIANTASSPARAATATAKALHSGISLRQLAPGAHRYPLFWICWYFCSALLVISLLSLVCSAIWAYSTERYLRGFSDAVVPAEAAPLQKVQAILNWMSRGPSRKKFAARTNGPDRDPLDTLNYASLLAVCGTATNAFVNLADAAGIPARRLLLLNSSWNTVHVVAEVLIGGRWIAVDPVFRMIFRSPDGTLLTRGDLANPAILAEVTRAIPNYDSAYGYARTAHIHFARIPYVGVYLQSFFSKFANGWEGAVVTSLLLERESLALFVLSVVLLICAAVARVLLRWYVAVRLGIHPPHAYERLVRAFVAFARSTA